MSYARWGWDNSDVYVFDSAADGGCLECCGCRLDPRGWSFRTRDVEEMIRHLAKHKLARHTVPGQVERDIRADFPDGHYDQGQPGNPSPPL